ncbi:MAG: hypothetical protein IJW08_09205 [Lentisphaeria bacterium]|nr:hypothetical protein [Lentisphaeria bacterium]
MKISSSSLLAALCAALVLCGCGKENEQNIPVASAELMLRFFNSMRNGDHASAVQQGIKLYTVDNTQDSVIQLVMLEQANYYVTQVQKHLNSGDLNSALQVLSEGMKRYPENKNLPQYYRRVRQLRNVRALLDAMNKADNSASMAAALTAARIGLAANMTPALEKHFAEYENKIAAVRSTEKKVEKTPSLVEPEPEKNKVSIN